MWRERKKRKSKNYQKEKMKKVQEKKRKETSSHFARISNGPFQLRLSQFSDMSCLRKSCMRTQNSSQNGSPYNSFKNRSSEVPLPITFSILVCPLQQGKSSQFDQVLDGPSQLQLSRSFDMLCPRR